MHLELSNFVNVCHIGLWTLKMYFRPLNLLSGIHRPLNFENTFLAPELLSGTPQAIFDAEYVSRPAGSVWALWLEPCMEASLVARVMLSATHHNAISPSSPWCSLVVLPVGEYLYVEVSSAPMTTVTPIHAHTCHDGFRGIGAYIFLPRSNPMSAKNILHGKYGPVLYHLTSLGS
jgi:hypothetical protein